jgi:heptaprenyl diphosphate synthase
MKTKQIAQYGLLIAIAMILSYVEAQIPAFFAIPGMKLGLTNVVVLYALYCMGNKSALMINFIRIFLVSMLFANGISIAYSIVGGLFSGIIMIVLKKTEKFEIVTVSIAGGVAHNIGQILVAMYLMGVTAIAWYLLLLWFTGIASGLLIGILGGELCRRLRKINIGGN